MKIMIFGASGLLGRIVTAKALERGHMVTAVVRNGENFDISDPHLVIVEADMYKPETFADVLHNQEAVLSCLGRRGHNAPMICRDGMAAIVPLMEAYLVPRLVAVSAFGAKETRRFSLYTRLLRVRTPKHMEDKDLMEDVVRKSKLDWTLIRPAAYLDKWPKKDYEILKVLPGLYPVVTRHAVADCMLDQLKTEEYMHVAPAVRAK